MVDRTRKSNATTAASLLLLAMLVIVDAAFHDGITGSSLRFEQRWNPQQQSRNLQSITSSTSAEESCEAAKQKEEADMALGGGVSQCRCQQSVLDERYADFLDMENQPTVWELTCVDQRCSYCSADGSTCDRFSYGALFEEIKVRQNDSIRDAVAQVGYFETNQYIVGRPESVVYTEYSDPESPGSHACSMEIDGLRCAVCEYVNCVSEEEQEQTRNTGDIDVYYGLEVVCSNILIGDGEGGYMPAQDFQTCDQEQLDAISGSQGVFEMYDPEYGQCFTSVEGCQRDKRELEQSSYYQCACLDGPEQGVSPFLENVMLQCVMAEGISNDQELCNTLERDEVQRTFSSYAKEKNTRTIELQGGSTVVIEEFDCLMTRGFQDGDCSQCTAFVDGTECDSCEMVQCGEGGVAASISCSNASDELSETINLCEPESSEGTPFEAFSVCGFGEHVKVPIVELPEDDFQNEGPKPVSLMACTEKMNEFLQNTNNFVDSEVLKCECLLVNQDQGVDAGTLLECRSIDGTCGGEDAGGSVCNADYDENSDGGLCFREEVVEGFLPDGSVTPLTRTTTYTHGTSLGNSMVGRTLVLTEFGNGSKGCQLLVDGESCSSCELKNCGGDIGMRPLVDCSNVVDDDSFKLDTCDAFASYEDGFLMRLTNGASEDAAKDFGYCADRSSGNSDVAVDKSLPKNCKKAQPLVLPTQEDDPDSVSRDMTNPNRMFAFVSFVSSTKGLSLSNNALSSVQEQCDEGGSYQKSPGLWYSLEGNGKGIHASVCREATDFDARISVYEGTCDSMDCVASTPMEGADFAASCDVHWVAEKGVTYYLRVHGTDESQTGTFNLFLETLDSETTETCYLDEAEEFDKACLSCSKARMTRIQQFKNDPADIDCQCIENEATGGFHLTCVDLSCLKCNSRQDVCGFDTTEQDIQLSGASPFGSYESFYFMDKVDGTQATEIVALQNTECMQIHDPYQQCMMAREELMTNALEVTPFFCECRQTSPNGHHMLICSLYDAYEFCEDDGACANQVLFGQAISQYGSVVSEFRNYIIQYGGESEEKSITVERFADMCVATINGETCSKCELQETCVGRDEDILDIVSTGVDASVFSDLSIDCSNLVQDTTAVFECGSADVSNKNNLLSIVAGSVSLANGATATINKQQTIPPEAFPPTMPPVTRPTSPPVDSPSLGVKDDEDNVILIDEKGDETNETATDSSAMGLMSVTCVSFGMILASSLLLL